MGSVVLLSQDFIVAIVRKVTSRGGVVYANSWPGTRTIQKENILYHHETGAGNNDQLKALYFTPTVIGYISAPIIHNDRDVYDDIRAKLNLGALYFFMGGFVPTRKALTTEMYPITVEEIHPGCLKGRERLITLHSGVYGWPGDEELHFIYYHDGRGISMPHGFVTTVDSAGVRTRIDLAENEAAVVKKIPISIQTEKPINLIVKQYDKEKVVLLLNGKGDGRLTMASGDFVIAPKASYHVETDGRGAQDVHPDAAGKLSFSILLGGPTQIIVSRATGG
jgi:hypothetical protein